MCFRTVAIWKEHYATSQMRRSSILSGLAIRKIDLIKLHSSFYFLYDENNKKRKHIMFRKIYRVLVLDHAASVANKTLATMSDRILNDIGQTRGSFAKGVVESVRKQLDREDSEAAEKKLANKLHINLGARPINAINNPNLVGAV